MTKSAIIDRLSAEADLPKKKMNEILESLVELSYKEAKNGFTIPGLGKLVCAARNARMGRNPQTGEAIKIPARTVLKFRVAKQAKDAILNNGKPAAKKAPAKAKAKKK